MPLAGKTLDERWLEFLGRSAPVTGAFPFLTAVLQEFYKAECEHGVRVKLTRKLKEFVKPLVRRRRSCVPPTSAEVVFWLENAREVLVEAILPVREELGRSGFKSVVIASAGVARQIGLASSEIIEFSAPSIPVQKRKWGAAFAQLEAALPGVCSENGLDNLLMFGAAADSLEAEIKRVLGLMRPRLVVLPVDQLMPGSSACLAARSLGIPSLVLLHGAVSAYNAPVNADEMGVWGEISKEQMCQLGVAPNRLCVLGSPRHDRPPYLHDPHARERLSKAVGCNSNPILTFFSNGNDLFRNSREAVTRSADWLSRAADELGSSINVLVRLHPNEDGAVYRGYKNLRVFKSDCDLGTTLAGSSVVAGLCSTCLLEGLLYGKPVLQFYADGWPVLADNWQRGLAWRTGSPGELCTQLKSLLNEQERNQVLTRQQALKSLIFANQGAAAGMVAEYIQNKFLCCAA